MALQHVTFNTSLAPAARVFRDGRLWYVAPAVSIVADGVLCGSRGCLLYPGEEISANVDWWNGMPLTVYHPVDGRGNACSADTPGVTERQGLGHVEDSVYNGKLAHKFWFDAEKTHNADKRHGTDIANRLEKGQPIEISTGLYTDNELAPPGSYNSSGRAYDAVARNYRPDHIAILPNGPKGACSVADGCGVGVANAGRPDCPT